MMTHLLPDLLSAYFDAEVTPKERRLVEAHLEACGACVRALADLRAVVTTVQQLDAIPAPPDLRPRVLARLRARVLPRVWLDRLAAQTLLPGRRAVLAAAALLVVGLFAFNLFRPEPSGRQAASVSTPSPLRAQPTGLPGLVGPAGAPVAEGPARQAQADRAGVAVPAFERQVIRRGALSLEVPDFDAASRDLVRIAEDAGGFVASSEVAREAPPYGRFVLRVPAGRFSAVLGQVERLGTVEERQVTGQDVTEEFVDLRARLRNLERHERQLLTFMERATKVSDLLAIEQELARVRGEIEQLAGRLRFLGDRVEMATIEVAVRQQPRQNTPGFWDFTATLRRIRLAFLGTVRQLLAASEWTVVALSALAPAAILGVGAWLLARWVLRRRVTPA